MIVAIEQGPLADRTRQQTSTALPHRRVLYTVSQKGQVAVHEPFTATAAAIHATESLHEIYVILVAVQNGQ